MSKDLVNVMRKLNSLGLHKEANIIKSAMLNDIVTEDSGLTIWLARVDFGDGIDTHYYFDSKEDADAWLEYETFRNKKWNIGVYSIDSVNVQRLVR